MIGLMMLATALAPTGAWSVNYQEGTCASSVGGFYTSYILSTGRRSTSFLVEALSLEAMARAGIVTISLDDQVSISLAPTASAAALRALGDCKTGLMRQWGVDPAIEASAVTPARDTSDSRTWFSWKSFPAEAKRARAYGYAVVLWAIGIDGRAKDCRIIVSSGNKALDAASCEGIVTHATYEPATGKDGKPMVTHASRRIVWLRPGR